VLKDISKVENDLLYLFTTIESDEQMNEAYAISKRLGDAEITDNMPKEIVSQRFIRAWHSLVSIRHHTHKIDNNPMTLYITLLRYALHTACFGYIPKRQRIWSICGACIYAEKIREYLIEKGYE